MKEIIFRALTFENKIIYEIGKIEFFVDGQIIVNDEIPVKQLIQYTGLKDKNGKEVYEEDIVSAEQTIITNGHIENERIVKWLDEDSAFGFYYLNGEKAGSGYVFCKRNFEKHFTIIGNIYENPELI